MTEPQDRDGRAGASARRAHERRKAKRVADVRARNPRTAGIRLVLKDAPQHETSWARGAHGEELTGQALAQRCPDVVVLHDRRIRGTSANIDHIAVAATGVWVIDTKRYNGRVEVRRPLLGKPTLRVGGRDKTKLVNGLVGQVALVSAAVVDAGVDVPVQGCFCFVDSAGLPVFGKPSINGLRIFGPRRLAQQLNAAGPLCSADAALLAAALAARFPPA